MLSLIAGAFISCDKDSDGDNTSSTPKEVKISYSYSNTEDFFDLMNVSVEYLDSEGALQKKSIDKNFSYEATVPYASAPKEYKFVVAYKAAVQGLEQPKEKYTFQQSFKASVSKVYPNGETKSVGYEAIVDNQPKNFSGDAINDYLTIREEELRLPFEVTLDGTSKE